MTFLKYQKLSWWSSFALQMKFYNLSLQWLHVKLTETVSFSPVWELLQFPLLINSDSVTSVCCALAWLLQTFDPYSNNNNNNQCESSPGSFDECRLSAGWPLTPDQANQLRLWVYHKRQLQFASTITIYYHSAWKLVLIYRSPKGEILSRPRHCSKGVQPRRLVPRNCVFRMFHTVATDWLYGQVSIALFKFSPLLTSKHLYYLLVGKLSFNRVYYVP